MRLAWPDDQLKSCCVSPARLRSVSGDDADAAEDLLYAIAQAPHLGALMSLRSIRLGVHAGGLTLSIEEVDMHARLLSTDGTPEHLADRASLSDHATSQSLLIDDLHVSGQSVLRLES